MRTHKRCSKSPKSVELLMEDGGWMPKILIWDLETAGTNAFCADYGYMVCFGYKWLGDAKARCISLLDYPGDGKWPKGCQDDTNLLKAGLKIMEEADLLVAHYGDRFDRKFFESRLLRAGLRPIPMTRQADTCLIARAKLKLSSNRLDNLAKFLRVKTRKMSKGDGWPNWWMGALRGDKPSIRKMAVYCAQDVQCLEECFVAMRHLIPNKYLINMNIGKNRSVCVACGKDVQYRGTYFSEKKLFRRFQCRRCGKWGHDKDPIKRAL
jgi:hypothetical protein